MKKNYSYITNLILLTVILCFSLFCCNAQAKAKTKAKKKTTKTKVTKQVISSSKTGKLVVKANNIATNDLTVHFINVGEGDSILLTCGGEAVLVDAGLKEKGPSVFAYLKRQGVNKLKYAIATHPHKDHIGGMSCIIDSMPIYKVMMPDYANKETCYKDMMQAINRQKVPVIHPKPDKEFEVGKAKIKILAPISSKYERENNYSIVAKVTYGSVSFLLAGDSEKESEAEMLRRYGKSLKSTFLKVGHHGSNTSSTDAFLKAVSPQYAVVSVGPNEFGHPGNKALQRIHDNGIKILRTDIHKDISLSTDGKKLIWR